MVLNKVKQRREQLNKSAEQLAKEASVSTPFIYMIESGRKVPSLGTAVRIAQALQARVDDIFFSEHVTTSNKNDSNQNASSSQRIAG